MEEPTLLTSSEKKKLRMADYDQVFTTHIGKLGLYRTSGHFPYYKESQFPPIVDPGTVERLATEGCSCSDLSNQLDSGEVDGYLLKPMKCPTSSSSVSKKPNKV